MLKSVGRERVVFVWDRRGPQLFSKFLQIFGAWPLRQEYPNGSLLTRYIVTKREMGQNKDGENARDLSQVSRIMTKSTPEPKFRGLRPNHSGAHFHEFVLMS